MVGGLVVLGVTASLFLQQSEPLIFAGRILLVVSVLLGGVRLFGAVRRGLRAQRGGLLEAASSSPDRGDVVPTELSRVMSEVAKGSESQSQYARSLAPRLARLAERRTSLSARPATPIDLRAAEGRPGSVKTRGPSVREIGEMVRKIKEL
jgi:hypothetical protein